MARSPKRARPGDWALALACMAALASRGSCTTPAGPGAPPPPPLVSPSVPHPVEHLFDTAYVRMIRGVVHGGEVDEWTLRFVVGQPVLIRVTGEGGSTLECAMRSAAGVLVAVHAARDGSCLLYLVPTRTEGYRVVIRNAGASAVPYQLVAR